MREYSPFGKQVMKAMIDKNMTTPKLAEKVGISVQYLREILKGTRIGKRYVPIIAKEVGIKLEQKGA